MLKCTLCGNDWFTVENDKITCDICGRKKNIKTINALEELENIIIKLKDGEFSSYSGWTDKGELMYKLLQEYKKTKE